MKYYVSEVIDNLTLCSRGDATKLLLTNLALEIFTRLLYRAYKLIFLLKEAEITRNFQEYHQLNLIFLKQYLCIVSRRNVLRPRSHFS